jgi:hypothetical protein
MSSFTNFVFGFILIIVWVVAGGYVTASSVNLTAFRNTDVDLHQAYWFTFWAAFTTWALIAIFIILVILSIIGVVALFGSGVGEAGVAAEGVEGESFLSQAGRYGQSPEGQSLVTSGISWLTIGFLIFALILVSITGVLSAIAASSMAASPNFDRSNDNLNTAYIDAIIAASISIGAAGILVIGVITYFIIGYRNQLKREEQLAEIHTVQQRGFRQRIQEQANYQRTVRLEQQSVLQRLNQQAAAQVPGYQQAVAAYSGAVAQ